MLKLTFAILILLVNCATLYTDNKAIVKVETDENDFRVICGNFLFKDSYYPNHNNVVEIDRNTNCSIEYFHKQDGRHRTRKIDREFNPIVLGHIGYYGFLFFWIDMLTGYFWINNDDVIYLED